MLFRSIFPAGDPLNWHITIGSSVKGRNFYFDGVIDFANIYTDMPPNELVFDLTLGAPACHAVGSVCDSVEILDGRGVMGPEVNAPNTLDNCTDGNIGTYHVDESVDRIRVYTTDGSDFAAGVDVTIEVTVWVWGASSDRLDLYYTSDANQPSWTFLTTLVPSGEIGRAHV